MPRVLVVHGPNLNLLGVREPAVYGTMTLAELDRDLVELGARLGIEVETFQANGEGALIDRIHQFAFPAAAIPAAHQGGSPSRGLVLNPGGYTHGSVALRDAIAAVALPTIEVHLSNLYAREPLRHGSVTAGVCLGAIMGLGPDSYRLALHALAGRLIQPNRGPDGGRNAA
jgi:3-dehydroquinate dehydratase-2